MMRKTSVVILFAIGLMHLGATARASESALVIHSAGADTILSDPKDQGLLRALKMVDMRVAELPGELGMPPEAAHATQLAWDVLLSPLTLRAGMTSPPLAAAPGQPAAPPAAPFFVQLDVRAADAARAQAFADRLAQLLVFAGPNLGAPQAAANLPGMSIIDLGGMPLLFGTQADGEKHRFVIAFGELQSAFDPASLGGAIPGSEPALAVKLDFGMLQGAIDRMVLPNFQEPKRSEVRAQLERFGIVGERPLKIEGTIASTGGRAFGQMRIDNYQVLLERSSARLDPALAITPADFARIPSDALYAQVGKYNPRAIFAVFDAIGSAMGPALPMPPASESPGTEAQPPSPGARLLGMIQQLTGIDLEADLIRHVGTTFACYNSDTTGGGGLASLVFLLELADENGFRDGLDKFARTLNNMAHIPARGYVRMQRVSLDGCDTWLLQFPGLPVPLEVAISIADGWVFAALNPQATLAAIAEAKDTAHGLADNPRFADAMKALGENHPCVAAEFMDTPRLASKGYGWAVPIMAALENAVRSPNDLERDPKLILPTHGEIVKDAKACLKLSYLDGDALVMRTTGDKSLQVNLCATMGVVGQSPLVAIGIAGLAASLLVPTMKAVQKRAERLHELERSSPDEEPTSGDDSGSDHEKNRENGTEPKKTPGRGSGVK